MQYTYPMSIQFHRHEELVYNYFLVEQVDWQLYQELQ